jgi:NADH-quinone oxidoreductase subunit N
MLHLVIKVLPVESILVIAGSVLLLVGAMGLKNAARHGAMTAFAALGLGLAVELAGGIGPLLDISWLTRALASMAPAADSSIQADQLLHYVRVAVLLVGPILILLAWPTRADGRGNAALDVGGDGAEFFGLALLSLAGVMLCAAANDIVLLFLSLEMVSIPTYVMVAMSRRAA